MGIKNRSLIPQRESNIWNYMYHFYQQNIYLFLNILVLKKKERGHEITPGVGDGQGGLACCDSWGRRVGHD